MTDSSSAIELGELSMTTGAPLAVSPALAPMSIHEHVTSTASQPQEGGSTVRMARAPAAPGPLQEPGPTP